METYLMHHGIKGQKWGIRRYQNEDGSYTEEGKRRRPHAEERLRKKDLKGLKKIIKSENDRTSGELWKSKEIAKESTKFIRRHISDADLNMLKSKKREFTKYIDVDDYDETDQYEKDFPEMAKKASEKTDAYFLKYEPETYKELLNIAGGDKAELTGIRPYDKIFESYLYDDIMPSYENAYKKSHPEIKLRDKAWSDYYDSCKEVGRKLIKDTEDAPIDIRSPWGARYKETAIKYIDFNSLLDEKVNS